MSLWMKEQQVRLLKGIFNIGCIDEADILSDIMGSDHCPVRVKLNTNRLNIIANRKI